MQNKILNIILIITSILCLKVGHSCAMYIFSINEMIVGTIYYERFQKIKGPK